ncbi:ribonuclease H-like domain-containing protein [Candidatus Altiarchaeota archaeon]
MLRSTFIHIQGIGEQTEINLWKKGVKTWDDALSKSFHQPSGRYKRIKAGILESKGRLAAGDHEYFRDTLPSGSAWRAYDDFRENACYLDIETTGLSSVYDDVTTVCLHSADATKTYIQGENLGDLRKDLGGYKYIVSFNGARFDLPFLSHKLNIGFNHIHLDLMYPLKRLGFSGGLKNIEKALGISRDSDGVTGYDAVRLWRSYRSGRTIEVAGRKVAGEKALELLVDYNREDTVNLERLADWAVGELSGQYDRYLKE